MQTLSLDDRVNEALERLDSHVQRQSGRLGLIQHWLDEQHERLDQLATRLEAGAARLARLSMLNAGRAE